MIFARGASLGLALALSLAACAGREASAPMHPAPSASVATPASSTAVVSATPVAQRDDPLWARARGDEPLELERLARQLGATALVEVVTEGGADAAVALAALPLADDAELALGPLAMLPRGRADRAAILEAIVAIAGRPRRSRETLDPEGMRASAEAMLALALDASAPSSERGLAETAARALADKGFLDPRRIPTDLGSK